MIRSERYFFVMLLVSLLTFGCFESSTDPDDGPDEPDDPFTVEATATIGSEGGTIASEGFELIVPAGAFTGSVDLEIASTTEDIPFESSAASKRYRIDGIPDDCALPLRLAIAYDDTLEDSSFIAIGEEVYVPSTGEPTTAFRLLSAADSSGRLVAEFPASDIETEISPFFLGGKRAPRTWEALAATRIKAYEDAQGKFRLRTNRLFDQPSNLDSLHHWLWLAWSELETMGFDPVPRRTEWPVDVFIWGLGGDVLGRFVPSSWRKNWATLEFDRAKMARIDEMRPVVFHEVAVFVEHLYAPVRRYEVWLGTEPNRLWMDEAVATYIAQVLTEGRAVDEGPVDSPFRGLQAGASSGARSHGKGLTRLVSHLRWDPPSGSGDWGDVYEQIEGGKDAIQSLAAVHGDLDDWYPKFLDDYVWRTQNDQHEDALVRSVVDEFRIDDENDTLKTFTYDYPDLSGRLYRIPLDYTGINPGASLNFSTRGRTAGIRVFAYAPDVLDPQLYSIVPIIESIDDVSVTDVADYYGTYTGLLALVTNGRWVSPYTDETEIELTIQLAEDPGYQACAFRIVDFLLDIPSGKETAAPRDEALYSFFGTAEGSFVGNNFVGTWSEAEYGTGTTWSTGTITVVLNAAKDSILSVLVEEEIARDTYNDELTFTAENIPRYEGGYGDLDFYVSEEACCDHVTGFDYETLIGYPGGPRSMESYSCSWRTELEITFFKEAPKASIE